MSGRHPTTTHGQRALAALVATVAAAAVAPSGGCGGGMPDLSDYARDRAIEPPPERPDCDARIPSGADLQARIEAAADGAVLCLDDGTYEGPVRVRKPLTLWGSREAVVETADRGTTVGVTGEGAALLGFTVDGSGGRLTEMDAAVRIRADGVRVEGLAIRDALFGVLAEKARDVELLHNVVEGRRDDALGVRGDTIRLWEVRDSRVVGNRIRYGRDLVIWYAQNNRIANNVVEHGRYGTHFMYSHGNRVVNNRYRDNVVGTFIMYSRNVHIRGNLFRDSGGSGGMGLGLKESGDLKVADNVFARNTKGIYSDTSPRSSMDRNVFVRNVVAGGDVGVVFHGRADQNAFRENTIARNRDPVRVQGNADAMEVDWRGNHFDEYGGYDLDGDGRGDVAFELRSLSSRLVGDRPKLAVLTGTPALWLVDAISRIAPLFSPRTLLRDPEPSMDPLPPRPEIDRKLGPARIEEGEERYEGAGRGAKRRARPGRTRNAR